METKYPSPVIRQFEERLFAGKKIVMSYADNKTGELWRSFMPERGRLSGVVGSALYSMQVFPLDYFRHFNPAVSFEKWAAVEIKDADLVPDGFETLRLPSGLYAVFHYKGSSNDTGIFQYIFSQWLPASAYEPDNRPHFEILGDKYKNADPSSEEEICIPVKLK